MRPGGSLMEDYQIELAEEAKLDLSAYNAYERKTIVSAIRDQLTNQPDEDHKSRGKPA